jgi:medium-chain acyl-[acyl-carrier-protein] hydrolase
MPSPSPARPAGNPWVVRYRPEPAARLRLFCLPHAGGGASAFRQWAGRMPAGVEVVAVQLPGREGRFAEPAFDGCPPLVAALADGLRPELDRPFALFGHSLGAIVAFELARHLARAGGPTPVHLFVSGSAAPHVRPPRPPVHDLPEAEFIAELRRRGGTPPAVLEHAELMQLLLPTLRADFSISDTYRCTPGSFDGPLTAYAGTDDATVRPEHAEAWREVTAGPFAFRAFPGGHFFPYTTAQTALLEDIGRSLARPEALR